MDDSNAVTDAVRRNVRWFRQSRNLTLQALADRSGVSKGMIVQIEQGRTNPSLTTLARLATALGVSLPRLVEVGQSEPARLFTVDESLQLWSGDSGGEGHLLASTDDPTSLQLWRFHLEPGEAHRAAPQVQGTVEIVHVQQGQLNLQVGGSVYEVATGESIVFRPLKDHEYRNEGSAPLRLTIASTEPSVHSEELSDE